VCISLVCASFSPPPKAEPRQYAGLALLKLADNFENHVAIAKAGGLTALLQLGRGGAVDEEYECVGYEKAKDVQRRDSFRNRRMKSACIDSFYALHLLC
jgi:hypothetical protein